jgi:uncharacterized protein (TIGR00255 family)
MIRCFDVDKLLVPGCFECGQVLIANRRFFGYYSIPNPKTKTLGMITSMTGYGRSEAEAGGITVSVEVRSVNNRFLEVVARLPRTLSLRENDIKEIVRKKISRGKINVLATIDHETNGTAPLRIDIATAKAYYALLNKLRKAVKIREAVKLQHLLQFSEIFQPEEIDKTDEQEWEVLQTALDGALESLTAMRRKEGGELEKDFAGRLQQLSELLERIEQLSRDQVPRERARLRERIGQILDGEKPDEGRLEQELAILADKLDVTEECVRFRSHVKFFRQVMAGEEVAGRKLNFLIQEMNRETNTIGSKSSDTTIAHLVVQMKEEMERIREQLQNIE